MSTSEVFNHKRMERSIGIAKLIVNNCMKEKTYGAYAIYATESVANDSFDELRKRYFSIGIPWDMTEIPFMDLLVVLSIVDQLFTQNKAGIVAVDAKLERISHFSVEEAVRLLSSFNIETPFDDGTYLRFRRSQS